MFLLVGTIVLHRHLGAVVVVAAPYEQASETKLPHTRVGAPTTTAEATPHLATITCITTPHKTKRRIVIQLRQRPESTRGKGNSDAKKQSENTHDVILGILGGFVVAHRSHVVVADELPEHVRLLAQAAHRAPDTHPLASAVPLHPTPLAHHRQVLLTVLAARLGLFVVIAREGKVVDVCVYAIGIDLANMLTNEKTSGIPTSRPKAYHPKKETHTGRLT